MSANTWQHALRRGITDIWFLLAVVISLLLVLTLLGYHPSDASWSHSGSHETVRHYFGPLGAFTADLLFSLLGRAAWALPVGLLLVGWQSVRRATLGIELWVWEILTFLTTTLALAGILSLNDPHPINAVAVTGGGLLGQKMSVELLRLLPTFAVMLIYSFFFALGLTILLELPWLRWFERLGVFFVVGISGILTFLGLRDLARSLSREETEKSDTRGIRRRLDPIDSFEPIPETPLWDDYKSSPEPAFVASSEKPPEPVALFDEEVTIPADSEPQWSPELLLSESVPQEAPLSSQDVPETFIPPPVVEKKNALTIEHLYPEMPPKNPQNLGNYCLPTLDLLDPPPIPKQAHSEDEIRARAEQVEQTLRDYRIDAVVRHVALGPVITRFELDLAPGTKVSQVCALDKDIARALAVENVRVVEVIPGKSFIGLELPNRARELVSLRALIASQAFQYTRDPLPLVLGVDIEGQPVLADLEEMPHLLVAGTTGSGKSVALHVMLASLLYKFTPEDLRLILIDPKCLEMSMYRDIPHLLTPVLTDMSQSEWVLSWVVEEMERRNQLMAALRVRNIESFNVLIQEAEARGEMLDNPLATDAESARLKTLPFVVLVIDELADMMLAQNGGGRRVEELITRIAQKARSAGIHLIIATQRPSVDVITGLIKANIPARIAFQVSSKIDSRTIIDQSGAETLLGRGDMLYAGKGSSIPQRVHGAFISEREVDALAQFVRSQGAPRYEDAILRLNPTADEFGLAPEPEGADDPLYAEACASVIASGKASISWLMSHWQMSFNRAAKIIEAMEEAGIVSAPERGMRKVLQNRME